MRQEKEREKFIPFNNLLVLTLLEDCREEIKRIPMKLSSRELSAARTSIVDNKATTGQVLKFYLPTYEQVRMLELLLKRCLASKDYALTVLCNTEGGFTTPPDRTGSTLLSMGDDRFNKLQSNRKSNAAGRLTVQVCRQDCYGGDVQLELYFYSVLDMAITSNLISLGLAQVYKTLECEQKNSQGEWVVCEPQGLCDMSIAVSLNKTNYANKCKVLDLIKQLNAEQEQEQEQKKSREQSLEQRD